MQYNPLTRRYWLSADTSVNYLVATPKGLMFTQRPGGAVRPRRHADRQRARPRPRPPTDARGPRPALVALRDYRPYAGAGARGMLGVAFGMTPEHPEYGDLREEFFRNYESCMTQRTYVVRGRRAADRVAGGTRDPLGRGDQQVDALRRAADPRHALFSTAPRRRGRRHHAARRSRIRRRCWRPRGKSACARSTASTWATTSATWSRAGPPACRRSRRPTATSAATRNSHGGARMPTWRIRLICCGS